jgi:hypothetical protein
LLAPATRLIQATRSAELNLRLPISSRVATLFLSATICSRFLLEAVEHELETAKILKSTQRQPGVKPEQIQRNAGINNTRTHSSTG